MYGANIEPTKGWQSSKVAEAYDARRFKSLGGRLYDWQEKKAIGNLLKLAEQRERVHEVLEMASGTGRISEVLANRGYTLTCGDVSREMQDVARRRLANGNVRFKILDICDIAEPDDAFDCVCAFRLFQHLTSEERARALREMARVSRRFVLVNVMYTSAYYGAVRRLRQALGRYTTRYTSTRDEIEAELRFAGLRLVRAAFTQPGFNGNLVLLAEKTPGAPNELPRGG
jgi:ubiquinone/menaquinone biosynthesis C-methylase UbiE